MLDESLFSRKSPKCGGWTCVVLMGVSGAGKTTVGQALARDLGWRVIDADDLHAPAAREKMLSGRPLTDSDRYPWLDRVRTAIVADMRSGSPGSPGLVVACSALRAEYRKRLSENDLPLQFVHLQIPSELAEARMRARAASESGFVMPPGLCASQFAALEPLEASEGAGCLEVDATEPVEVVVARIRDWLDTPPR